jgi:hypothetical protein
MDLSELLTAFPPDPGSAAPGQGGTTAPAPVREVVAALGGISFAGGLYRVLPASAVDSWTRTAAGAFPELQGRATVFAVDWSGRLFAADAARSGGRAAQRVLVLDPGAGEAHESRSTVAEMHTWEMLEQPHALLRQPDYEKWRLAADDDRPLLPHECVGYRVPLFLGGPDDVSNRERTGLADYWQRTGQLRREGVGSA